MSTFGGYDPIAMAPSMRERAGSESHVVCDKTAVYDRWFQYADQDRDGRVTGKDAVGFFERSDLSREVLFKVSRQMCMHASMKYRARRTCMQLHPAAAWVHAPLALLHQRLPLALY